MAGNKNSGGNGKSGKHDIAPAVRGAFLEALEIIKREDGKTFPQIIADWMREDPIKVLTAVSKFTVREATVSGKVQHDHKHRVSAVQDETQRIIDGLVGFGVDRDAEEVVSSGLVLPDSGDIQPH